MRILIVQTSFLGDVVLTTPLIGALLAQYPHAEIHFLSTPKGAELLRHDSRLKSIIAFDKRGADRGITGILRLARRLREMQFDRVYALQRSFRTSLLLWFARIPLRIGFSAARGSFFYHVKRPRNRDLHEVQRNLQILEDLPSTEISQNPIRLFPSPESLDERLMSWGLDLKRPFYIIAPGSAWFTKRWAEHYRELVTRLCAQGRQLVISGDPAERALAEEVSHTSPVLNLAGKLHLSELVDLVSRASLAVANDSMIVHVAAAFSVPTVAIFCATSPRFGFSPWNQNMRVVEDQELLCRPCGRHGGAHCPTGTKLCMTRVSVESVLAAIADLMTTSDSGTKR